MNISIVDAWAQPASQQILRHVPEVRRLLQRSGSYQSVEDGLSLQEMVSLMDEAGIQKVMLSAWHRPGKCVISNDDIAEIVRLFPDRFIGVAAVNLEKPVEAVRELERAVNHLGFKALRVIPWLWNLPPNDRRYYPLYMKCVELQIPFCTQVGHTGPLMPSEPGRPIPYLEQVAFDFPELKIVAGHIGYPWTDEMISLAWKHDNVFIDTSAYLPKYYPIQLVQFMKTYGKEKVLFGTNFPQLSFKRCTEQLELLSLKEEVKACFLYKNAANVFQLEPFTK